MHQLVPGADPGDQVAAAKAQGVADEADGLGPPGVTDGQPQLAGNQSCDLVFEPLFPLVGIGKVVRIGADAQDTGRAGFSARLCSPRHAPVDFRKRRARQGGYSAKD